MYSSIGTFMKMRFLLLAVVLVGIQGITIKSFNLLEFKYFSTLYIHRIVNTAATEFIRLRGTDTQMYI